MKQLSFHIEAPSGRQLLHVPDDRRNCRLTELLRGVNLPLNTRCGGRGICEGCLIELRRGTVVHATSGEAVTANGEPQAVRACVYQLGGDEPVEVYVPARAMLAYEPQIVTDFKLNVPRAHAPLAECALGAAVDVGTTTVAVMLVDLSDGKILSRAAMFNQQIHLGDDVVTRITLCTSDPAMLGQLQDAIANRTIAPLLKEALEKAGATAGQLGCISVAGNTTMLHLLAGVDPAPMGVAPFTPVFLDHRILRAGEIFRNVTGVCAADAAVHLLPGAAAYIGADLTAGAVASGLLYDEGPSLLVDVGTNGEVILKHGGRLYGCATAAGPAFEGAGLSSGVRAGKGAISQIRLTRRPFTVSTSCIGGNGAKPIGLCGSAYIDFLAKARRVGLLTATGRFDREKCPDAANHLMAWHNGDLAFRAGYAQGKASIAISQLDISRLLQAKAAVAAGILTLLHRVGLAPADVKTLYLAGGFGSHMSGQHAIDCGLLPGFTRDQIQVVGNTSLGGAYLALLDRGALGELAKVGRDLETIELNLDSDFEGRYIDQLCLPEASEP